ncbi:pyridoxamine 5'-phosphate oxidase family protein [Adlercreutzia aquisgranensis]|uniref:pyridoxamine 5'-phosphate oxidase family protein n=1 Tax=Adlercreutzia aquisgranensis TaxID=2941323 RepID=UPI002041F10C|nr:pyridoxamine 5'-phosphate oxidase family protein [Adlercreutzia aquisgranensis]
MQKIVEFLAASPVQYLATVGTDGKAKCRPFMFLMEVDGKLWFGTNNKKAVFAEMQANPTVEVCTSTPDFRWIRISGNATFEDNRAVKEACMNIPMLKEQYQTADNPIFEVFYLADGQAVIADMTGAEPTVVNL